MDRLNGNTNLSNIALELAERAEQIAESLKQPASKVYIAGPVTNIPQKNKSSFILMTDLLTKKGHIPLSTEPLPFGFSEKEYMTMACAMMECCDTIDMLPNWEASLGATAEYYLAKKLGMRVLEANNANNMQILLDNEINPFTEMPMDKQLTI